MKFLKAFVSLTVLYVLLVSTGSQISSCTKNHVTTDTVTIKDTITIRDTTIIRDTTTIHDTSCTNGLVAYYNFNGGSLHDSSGYKNDIIFNNAILTSDRFGHPNNAYLFNGSSSYMEVANSTSLNPSSITLMAIIKVNGFNTANCHANQIMGKGYPDYDNGFYVMRFSDVNTCTNPPDSAREFFDGQYGDNNPQGTDASAGPDSIFVKKGVWYNLVYTYDGVESRFYINGVLKSIVVKSAAFTPDSFDLSIGKHNDPNYPYYFNGVIDEIRIYNRPLTQSAITRLNNSTN